jgi:hypothetical protein
MSLQERQQPLPGTPWGGQGLRQEKADRVDLQRTAFEAFARELPALLGEQAGKWVAYHGAERLGIADDDADLYELGRQRGLSPQSMLVIGIDPEADQIPIVPESEFSSHELAAETGEET